MALNRPGATRTVSRMSSTKSTLELQDGAVSGVLPEQRLSVMLCPLSVTLRVLLALSKLTARSLALEEKALMFSMWPRQSATFALPGPETAVLGG